MLDIEIPEQLIGYLRDTDRITADAVPTVCVLEGGVSNRTVLVTLTTGEAWVLKQALEKLRVKADWFSDPARVHREADGIRALNELLEEAMPDAVPGFIFEDERHHILTMEAVPQPHENWKTLLLRGEIESPLVEQFGRMLGVIHRDSHKQHDEYATRFADRSFFENLRLEPYYAYTAEQTSGCVAAPFLHMLITDIRANPLCLVHGDYSPKNILVRDGRLVLLDHEVIHFGDPAFDLGFAMTHLLSKAHHVSEQRDAFAEATRLFWATYADAMRGLALMSTLEPRAVRATLGCLLARVDGRSPLEYLTDEERVRQRRAVLALMSDTPTCVGDLVTQWIEKLK